MPRYPALTAVLFVANFATGSLADGVSGGSEDYDEVVKAIISKLESKLLVPAYPDIEEAKSLLLFNMPKVTDEMDSISDFDQLRGDLGSHGTKIQDFSISIQEVCNKLDKLDRYFRKGLVSSETRLITTDSYDTYIVPFVTEMKVNCQTNPKSGIYWELYDDAINALSVAEDTIEQAKARCRDLHPDTC